MKKPILITPGEPAGIGPDIVIRAAQEKWHHPLVAIADPDLLQQRAALLKLPLQLHELSPAQLLNLSQLDADALSSPPFEPGHLFILPIALRTAASPGKLNPVNAAYVVDTLNLAAQLCLEKKAHAVVTGPVHKEVINQAGIAFSGHTEFFAACAQVKRTVMLFVTPQMKVALATTHLPLAQVATAIQPNLLTDVIQILQQGLTECFQIKNPRLHICGLNPHAGEGGYLGREEMDIITPTLEVLRSKGLQLQGPLPADTIFTPASLAQCDAILAMYHDQALPVVKYAGFHEAVNVTLGLPFIRTSVDHGTALDLAGKGTADAGSLLAAIRCAASMK